MSNKHRIAVVLGSGLKADGSATPVTEIRARAAAELLATKGRMKVICSGSRAPDDRGEHGSTEAQVMADIIVAQGTEGGGHVGVMSTLVLVPQVARAVAPTPVIAAGGFADGAGLAAALALGAQGVLMGTRFLATPEGPWPAGFKNAIVRSNGHDTLLSEIPDVITGRVWPGAYARVIRNRMMEMWLGRLGDLRYKQRDALAQTLAARETGDADMGTVYSGQTAGLVSTIEPAAHIVQRVVEEAEVIIRQTLPALVK